MPLVLAGFDSKIECMAIRPTTPHRTPLVQFVVEELIQSGTVPECTRDAGIIPEHRPWFSSILLFSLPESVLGCVVLLCKEEEAIGGGRELVRAVIAVGEQGSGAGHVHVVEASLVEVLVRGEQPVVGAGSGHERGCHLGVSGGAEVPVVGSFRPSTVVRNCECTVLDSIGDRQGQNLLRNVTGVLTKDSKGTHGKAAVADTVPVAVDGSGICSPPPAGRTVVRIKTGLKTVLNEVCTNLGLLIIGEDLIEPIVRDAERRRQLCGVEKVAYVPPVVSWTPSVADSILFKIVSGTRSRKC